MKTILAIDTSTEACSVALSVASEVIEQFEIARQRHTELVLPMVDKVLAEAELSIEQIDVLAFGRGPGSFTGIRIGTGVVQGIALGAGLPVAAVSSLAAIAQGVYRTTEQKQVIAAIDARMQEIYWGCFQLDAQGYMQATQDEVVARPEQLPLPEGDRWFAAGSAWDAYKEELTNITKEKMVAVDGAFLPHAQDVAMLARDLIDKDQLVSAEKVRPVYLRNEVAWKKAK
ncbi:MAG: tRNA (adenosine(37)-N6)-threonylcarbamoyltransferase complex dimerization subunit type 1 TsaB [Gammaproteobacteria bacterium]|nr:tRNA (adenosine(37)-N6)-threonylcarbamoyltransferase complex dimerization subunit type 1 TsaB [Gammaproteobacteria bacterium]